MANQQMTVNFIPDGKTKGMSVLNHQVDAAETAKGKPGKEGAAANAKQVAGVGADGKLSKKALAKLNKKEAKKDKKAGNADAAPAKGANKGAKPDGKAKAYGASFSNQTKFFDGAAADLWESLLHASGAQWLLGAKLTQADAEALKMMGDLKPRPATHPNLYSWAAMVTKFSPSVSSKWSAGELPLPVAATKQE